MLLLSGCTASFCSDLDEANMLYPYEQGVTVYCDKDEIPEAYVDSAFQVFEDNDTLYGYVPYDEDGNFASDGAEFLVDTIIATAESYGQDIPSDAYFTAIDQKVVEVAVEAFIGDHGADSEDPIYINGEIISVSNITAEYVTAYTYDSDGNQLELREAGSSALREYGYLKYWGPEDDEGLWVYWDAWTDEFRASDEPGLGYLNCPSAAFEDTYKTQVEANVSSIRSCIATSSGYFGHYGLDSDWSVSIEEKSWSYAWSQGFLEGLIVYPVAWLTDTIAYAIDASLSGFSQIIALCIVTLIVRAFMVLVSFRSTLSQQRMQALQPQMAKLQAKYPNSDTNQAQKQRLAQEQMALYKRNKIHPFSVFLVMIVQFPLFICVWGAFQGSAALSSGAVLNLSLSDTIWSVLSNFTEGWYLNSSGWWTALVLYILMAAAQICSMLVPQILQKRRMKKVARLTRNPAQDKNMKTMKWVSWGMMIFTCLIGLFLPSAMAVYWFIGAIISLTQNLITQLLVAKQLTKKKKK